MRKRCYDAEDPFCSLPQDEKVLIAYISREKDFDKSIGVSGRYVISDHPISYHVNIICRSGDRMGGPLGKDWGSSIKHISHLIEKHDLKEIETVSENLSRLDTFPFYPVIYEEFTEVKNMIAVSLMFK